MIALLLVVTTVVSLITFTMADMFHQDKKAYVSDMVSVIAVHAAEELAEHLRGRHFDALWSSPLRRARDTAKVRVLPSAASVSRPMARVWAGFFTRARCARPVGGTHAKKIARPRETPKLGA